MQRERASKKQQELLSFVDGFIKGNGYGPSYREIMRALGYKSVSTVAVHVDGLIAKGYLQRKDNSARSLEVVTTRSEGATASTSIPLEDNLEAYIDKKELSGDDKQVVKSAMQLLGFMKIVEKMEEDAKGHVESH